MRFLNEDEVFGPGFVSAVIVQHPASSETADAAETGESIAHGKTVFPSFGWQPGATMLSPAALLSAGR